MDEVSAGFVRHTHSLFESRSVLEGDEAAMKRRQRDVVVMEEG